MRICREYAANLYTGGLTPIPSAVQMEDVIPEEERVDSEEEMITIQTPIPATAVTSRADTQVSVDGSVELSPLIPQSTVPSQTVQSAQPQRRGRFPLIRQQSAPPESFFSRMGPSQNSVDSGHFLPEFPNVQLRKKGDERKSRPSSGESGASLALDQDTANSLLRKALRSSKSTQYKGVCTSLSLYLRLINTH